MRRGSVIFVTIFLLALALPFASSLPRNEQVNIVRGGNSETSCSDEICTTTFYADHRYWQTSERNWAPIDRNFYECSDEEHTRYCTEDYYLSVEADDRGHITLSSEDASLSFWPILEDENRSLDIGTRGNIVRYENIMEGVEMRYHYGIDSVKEEIIIDEPLETEGDLTFSFGYEGDIEEFAIEQSYICDARGACIYLDQEIDVGTMTISVPSDYLEDESIVYPLVIDPTITLNHSRIGWNGGVEYTPFLFESDAYLRISNPSNFLHSGNVTPDCGAPNCVALPVYMQSEIEWNLNTLPDGATILSANMTLFVNSTDSVPLTLKLAPMDKNHIQYPDTTDVCQGNCEFYNDIGNGTAYAQTVVNGNTFFTTLTLNSAARSAMEHAVASGEVFAVGISSNLSKRLVLGSRDNANASRRPSLTLTYTLNNSLLYDANGNLIQGFGKYLEYDSFNHLSVVRVSNATGQVLARYFYDHEGKRIKKIEYRGGDVNNNETTYYVSDSFLVVVNATGTFNYTYYYVNDKLLAMKDPNGVKTYYHPDHLGSTTLITNSSGAVVEEEFYLPFGEVYQGSETSRYLYTGKELDRDTDFYYYGARYYQDDFMHFLQPDPLIQNIYEPADLNRYAYVRNNPYKYTDPSGNIPLDYILDPIFLVMDIDTIIQNPTHISSYVGLLTDVVLTALPYTPALAGFAIREAKVADKIKKVENIAETGSDLDKTITEINFKELPKEVQETIKKIDSGNVQSLGPHPFENRPFSDGSTPLPVQSDSKYYTAYYSSLGRENPQRIVTGVAGEQYYTAKHYSQGSFSRIINKAKDYLKRGKNK